MCSNWYLSLILCCSAVVLEVKCSEKLLVDQLRTEFLNLEDELWNFVLDRNGNERKSVDPGLWIIKRFHTFDSRIQQMPQDLLEGLEVPRQARQFLLLYSDMRVISDMYAKFRRYLSTNIIPSKKDYSEYKIEITTTGIVDDILHDAKNNVNKTIEDIFKLMFDIDTDNIISEMFDIMISPDYNCKNPDQSPRQVFYNLYNTIALVDLKGYVMSQFAYMALRLERKGNYTESSLIAREHYQSRSLNTSIIAGGMEMSDGKVWKCDPKKHQEGKTYEQVTRLLQGHIQNEVDLNRDGTCTETCEKYSITKSYGCYDSSSEYCRKMKQCQGKILNCKFIESDMKVCISPARSSRRYEFIQYDSGKTMGQNTRCDNRMVESWLRWFVHCSTCFCLCDEQGPMSDRYFNLRSVEADVTNNRVVTGLRIIKHNRIFHLQIQEGKLLPYGFIDNSTVRWVPVDNYKITDSGIKNGLDYHTMDYEKRTLFLDDLESEKDNQIVTGVKFEFKNGNLRFQIKVTPFNFTTGKLSSSLSYYVSGQGGRQRIDTANLDVPTNSPQSQPIWGPNRYVEFTHTSFDTDAAQTTIPFIDIQPVTSYPQVPLKGAGLYYKGRKGYGGFIAPKITTYHFVQHMYIDFPQAKPRLDDYKELEVMVN